METDPTIWRDSCSIFLKLKVIISLVKVAFFRNIL